MSNLSSAVMLIAILLALLAIDPVIAITAFAGFGGTLFAHILATGRHHPISAPFDLSRFDTGALIDEAHAGVAH